MRIVLDTNVLVRAAANEEGLAGRLLQEISAGPHVLVTSPYVLSEIARVLAYARLQARWRLGEKTVAEFVGRVDDIAEIVLTTTPDQIVTADPDDDPVVQTAVLGGADVLCTRDRHLLDRAVVAYCAGQGIRVVNDIDLYHILTGRPKGRLGNRGQGRGKSGRKRRFLHFQQAEQTFFSHPPLRFALSLTVCPHGDILLLG